MKTIILFMLTGAICFSLGNYYSSKNRVHILRQTTDSRGLISVQYTQDGKEYAQDYLTETEYLKLINE